MGKSRTRLRATKWKNATRSRTSSLHDFWYFVAIYLIGRSGISFYDGWVESSCIAVAIAITMASSVLRLLLTQKDTCNYYIYRWNFYGNAEEEKKPSTGDCGWNREWCTMRAPTPEWCQLELICWSIIYERWLHQMTRTHTQVSPFLRRKFEFIVIVRWKLAANCTHLCGYVSCHVNALIFLYFTCY